MRFADALSTMWQQTDGILIEVGPGKTLGVLAMQHPARQKAGKPRMVSSLRHGYDNQSDTGFLMQSLGRVWAWGADVDWGKLHAGEKRRRVSLPGYPFERSSHWIEGRSAGNTETRERLESPGSTCVDEWFYVPSWKRSTHPYVRRIGATETADASWLVFMDNCGLGVRIRDYLVRNGQRVKTVFLADHFDSTDENAFAIDATKPDDVTRLFRRLGDFLHPSLNIVHLGCVSGPITASTQNNGRNVQELGFYSLLHIAQTIGDLGISGPIRIGVVSNGVHLVTGEEELCPEKATVLGPCGVIPKEYSNVTCFSIDLAARVTSDDLSDDLVARLTSEFMVRSRDQVVAYRGMFRWVRVFEPFDLRRTDQRDSDRQPKDVRLRRRGVYLITGGTGGIGLTIAKFLAREFQARLAFTRKSAFPARSAWGGWVTDHPGDDATSNIVRQIIEMEQAGAEVMVFTADAADGDRMRSVIHDIQAKFGQINGVIHAAGIVRPGIIQAKIRETAESVLSAKVQGTLVLSELLKETSLDFLVLFSSISSVLTPYAEVDYSAANSFLDAFAAHSNRRNPFRTLTINWPGWKEVGQLAELKTLPGVEEWKKAALKRAISPKNGLEAFRLALDADVPQLIVSQEDLRPLYDQSINSSDTPAEYLMLGGPPRVEGGGQRLRRSDDPPRTEVEKAVARIWEEVLGAEPIGVHESFAELGGHSLLAMRIVTRLRDAFRVNLTLRLMLDNPTIAGLSSRIEEVATSEIEALSDEEARRMLLHGTRPGNA